MDRAFSSGASGTPPTAPVSPSIGYATAGNPGTGTPATKPGAWWYHLVTEELRAVIVAAGLTPDHTNTTQLAQAVQALIAAGASNDYKYSCRAATTANIASLAGGAPNTLDGVALVANDRVLVKDQSTGSQNGIYYVSTLGTGADGTWTRATDADGAGELSAGTVVAVEEGTASADTLWMLTTDGSITIGTTVLTFVRKDAVTIPDASETVKGKVELADATETRAMTDPALAVSPANYPAPFTGANQSLAASGYQKLPGGLVLQWGTTTSISGDANLAITFPIAFPTACRSVVVTGRLGSTTAGEGYSLGTNSYSTSGFTLYNDSNSQSAAWFAIGH